MLWQNDRTIVVGKYQCSGDQQYLCKGARYYRGSAAVGRRCVYHDRGNSNFTLWPEAVRAE